MSAPITALYRALQQQGVSLRTVARESGVARSTARSYLLGLIQVPAPSTTQALLDAAAELGVTVDEPWSLVKPPIKRAIPKRTSARRGPRRPAPEDLDQQEEPVIPTKTYLQFDELQHFSLAEDPFDIQRGTWQPPRFKFHRRALIRSIERREIVALIGEAGAGKSTLLRTLHSQVDGASVKVRWMTPGNLDRGSITEGSLATAMLRDLGRGDLSANSAERRGHMLREELQARVAQGEWPVLAIDEGHDLSGVGLIAIKRIWDSFTFNRSLAVILAGQPPLKLRLQGDRSVREVAGRTAILEIPPLKPEDIADYLRFRFAAIGADATKYFDGEACAAIAQRGGVGPLWVDAIAAHAMRAAFLRSQTRVTAALVFHA